MIFFACFLRTYESKCVAYHSAFRNNGCVDNSHRPFRLCLFSRCIKSSHTYAVKNQFARPRRECNLLRILFAKIGKSWCLNGTFKFFCKSSYLQNVNVCCDLKDTLCLIDYVLRDEGGIAARSQFDRK